MEFMSEKMMNVGVQYGERDNQNREALQATA
jgi:hypothetical protein